MPNASRRSANVMWRRAISLVILAGHNIGESARAVGLLIRATLANDGTSGETRGDIGTIDERDHPAARLASLPFGVGEIGWVAPFSCSGAYASISLGTGRRSALNRTIAFP